MRIAYIALMFTIIFFHLLPLNFIPRGLISPDWMLLFTFAWLLRMPRYVPIGLIAALFLLSDMIFLRPPGLWTALVVVACIRLRSLGGSLRAQTFVMEWFSVAVTAVLFSIGYMLVLGILLYDIGSMDLFFLQLAITVLCYPVAVFVSQSIFNVRKPSPRDIEDTLGDHA